MCVLCAQYKRGYVIAAHKKWNSFPIVHVQRCSAAAAAAGWVINLVPSPSRVYALLLILKGLFHLE